MTLPLTEINLIYMTPPSTPPFVVAHIKISDDTNTGSDWNDKN